MKTKNNTGFIQTPLRWRGWVRLTTLALALVTTTATFAQVGIGTKTPAPSAVLDLTTTDKGFLPPRLTTAQRGTITSPATGLTIYNTDTGCLEFWNGTNWVNACSGSVILTAADCDNDVSVGTGNIVRMMYDYDGNGTAEYRWCAREITQAMENAAHPLDPAPLSGKVWLDRNLGAYQYSTSATDAASYGDLYQWGRRMDGHQKRTQRTGDPAEGSGTQGTMVNGTTTTLADNPSDALFIRPVDAFNNPVFPGDWRLNQNDNLWTPTRGVNDPCPAGFYVAPFEVLDNLEVWLADVNASSRAINNTLLNLPMGGERSYVFGLRSVGTGGWYWSSLSNNVGGSFNAFSLGIFNTSNINGIDRAEGHMVRCVRD